MVGVGSGVGVSVGSGVSVGVGVVSRCRTEHPEISIRMHNKNRIDDFFMCLILSLNKSTERQDPFIY